MTKKEIVLNSLKVVNAKEVNGVYEITMNQFYELDAELGNTEGADYSFCSNRKDENLKAVYDSKKKTRFAILRIVPERTTNKRNDGPRVVKEKGNGYVVKLTISGKIKINDKMTTCKEMKEFIKSLKGKKVEKLEIYKMGVNYENDNNDIIPTRKSAWR